MITWVKQLDRVLRGDATRLEDLRKGQIDIPVGGLVVVLCVLGVLYGVCMGLFSVITTGGKVWQQMGATMVKVPALFFLTLLVTFPSLYVFNALVGSRLTIKSVLQLLIAALGVILAVLASLGTIVAFFSVSTDSYHFMILLNVVVFAVSGLLGLVFLMQTMHRLTAVQEEQELAARPIPAPPPLPVEQGETQAPGELAAAPSAVPPAALVVRPGALDALAGRVPTAHVRRVFRIWVIVFGLVGAQMGWILRPFIGNPQMPFSWFRPRGSNFFEAVMNSLRHVLGW